MSSNLTIEYKPQHNKFSLLGKDALGYKTEKRSLDLTPQEILMVIEMHERGVFTEMMEGGATNLRQIREEEVEDEA